MKLFKMESGGIINLDFIEAIPSLKGSGETKKILMSSGTTLRIPKKDYGRLYKIASNLVGNK